MDAIRLIVMEPETREEAFCPHLRTMFYMTGSRWFGINGVDDNLEEHLRCRDCGGELEEVPIWITDGVSVYDEEQP